MSPNLARLSQTTKVLLKKHIFPSPSRGGVTSEGPSVGRVTICGAAAAGGAPAGGHGGAASQEGPGC